MKTIVRFFLVVIVISASCNNSHKTTLYEQTLRDAKRQHKFLLLDFSAEWCGGCKGFDKYIFQDSLITKKLSGYFLFIKIDRDNPENYSLVHKYKIQGLPHIVLIDTQEHILGSVSGFDSKFIENPDLFISRLNNIIELQDSIKKLETIFYFDTTNIEAINNLLNVYTLVNQYTEIQNLKDLLVRLDPTPERIFELNYNQAIFALQNRTDTELIMRFIRENPKMDYIHRWGVYSELLYHYRDMEDIENEDKYYLILIKLDPDYFKHKYAEFLFENKIKIDTAISLSNEIISDARFGDSFLVQFLTAHKLAYSGKVDQAVQTYSAWMEKNKDVWISGDDYWILYFYSKFSNYHNVDLARALAYIQIAEKNRNMPEEKLLMAEILYKLGRVEESLEKLNEALQLTDNQFKSNRIIELIKKYSGKEMSRN